MFTSTIVRTLDYAVRSWKTILLVTLIGVVSLVIGGIVVGVVTWGSTDMSTSAFVTVAVLVALGYVWFSIALTRAAWPQFGVVESLEGAFFAIPRAIGLVVLSTVVLGASVALTIALGLTAYAIEPPVAIAIVVGYLALVLLLYVPYCIAMGSVARGDETFGFAPAWRYGVRRIVPNIRIALGALVILAGTIGWSYAVDAFGTFAFQQSYGDIEVHGGTDLFALLLLSIISAFPPFIVQSALVSAVHDQARASADEATWRGEDLSATAVPAEMSAAVQRLLDMQEASEEAVPVRAARLRIPPRADAAGRLPGPGAMRIGAVILPAGSPARPVTAETLELDGVVVRSDEDTAHIPDGDTMWITSQAQDNAAALWKQLAAEFAGSGLWPVLVPDAGTLDSGAWIEQDAVRLRGAHDGEPGAEQVLVPRLEASLIDTPITNVDRLRSSSLSRGELAPSSGKRADAIGATIGRIGAARVAVVPAERPADVPTVLAWPGLEDSGIASDELSSVIAAWERSYGALLVAITAHALVFAVVRPPANEAEAIEIVAQQHALCPDEALPWTSDTEWATTLVDAPMWTLTWA